MMALVRDRFGNYLQGLHYPARVEEITNLSSIVGWCWGPFRRGEENDVAALHSEKDVSFMRNHPKLWAGKGRTPPSKLIPVVLLADGKKKFLDPIPFQKRSRTKRVKDV